MKNIQKILMPTDFSECANRATELAALYAGLFDAELLLLHVATFSQDFPVESWAQDNYKISDQLEVATRMRMESAISGFDLPRGAHFYEIKAAEPGKAIAFFAAKKECNLIVMGSHGRKGAQLFLFGSVAEEVVYYSPCQVLTLKQDWVGHKPKKILVPIDFSEASKHALKNAVAFADMTCARLVMLHVLSRAIYPEFIGFPSAEEQDYYKKLEESTQNMLRALLHEENPGLTVEIHVVDGTPARAITRFAEDHDCDMIVMAHHGMDGFIEQLIGSTTQSVLRKSKRPVMTLRTHDKPLSLALLGMQTGILPVP